MMTPEGGGGGGHQHGDGGKPSKAGQGKTMTPGNVPAEFHSQLQKLESAYEAIAKAVKLKDISLVRNEFQVFGEALSKVDGGLLSGHLRMLWNELSMLLNNDAVEGRDVKKFTEIDRVFKVLTKNMRRVRERLGTSHDAQSSRPSQHLEVPAVFQAQLFKLWEAYLSLQQALASDNLLLAQQAVTHFQTSLSEVDAKPLAEDAHQVWKKEYSKFVQTLQSMNLVEDLKSIREKFSLLSDELLVLINIYGPNGFRTVYKLYCPMAFGSKGAMWLQEDKQVSNPYFGKAMLKCADPVELISSGKTEEHKGEHHHE
jgi:Cu(I)/Ag(I) efflux system membrane fusion protein